MHLPVFALVPCRKRRLSRDMGIVPVFIRVVLYYKPYPAFVIFQEFPDGRTGRDAVGSLEIEKLDYGDRSILRAVGRRAFTGHNISLLIGIRESRKNNDRGQKYNESFHFYNLYFKFNLLYS